MPEMTIARLDDNNNLVVDTSNPAAQALMGGGGGGMSPWAAFPAAFAAISGWLNRDTADTLQADLEDKKKKLDAARKELRALAKGKADGDPATVGMVKKQIEIDRLDSEVVETDIQLARLQRTTNTDIAIAGGSALLTQYMGGGGMGGGGQIMGYAPGPGGGLLPIFGAGVVGYELGKDARRDRG